MSQCGQSQRPLTYRFSTSSNLVAPIWTAKLSGRQKVLPTSTPTQIFVGSYLIPLMLLGISNIANTLNC
ncbi:hypothetical protein WVIC16_60105 [Weissella viridescens]|nr:hypothetical protein WVIC16_60105 [Weissella viridescens]